LSKGPAHSRHAANNASLGNEADEPMRMIRKNGIDLLLSQHQQVRELLEAVQFGPIEEQQARFDELREFLAVHETAEQVVLRPLTRATVAGGNEIADVRMAEENAAKKALAELEKLEVNSDEFIEKFATFKAGVLEHAANEEAVEFGVLRAAEDPTELAQLAGPAGAGGGGRADPSAPGREDDGWEHRSSPVRGAARPSPGRTEPRPNPGRLAGCGEVTIGQPAKHGHGLPDGPVQCLGGAVRLRRPWRPRNAASFFGGCRPLGVGAAVDDEPLPSGGVEEDQVIGVVDVVGERLSVSQSMSAGFPSGPGGRACRSSATALWCSLGWRAAVSNRRVRPRTTSGRRGAGSGCRGSGRG
jgi:hypothetical protein